jgi:hypothetical protein
MSRPVWSCKDDMVSASLCETPRVLARPVEVYATLVMVLDDADSITALLELADKLLEQRGLAAAGVTDE